MERTPHAVTNAPVQEAQIELSHELAPDLFVTEASFVAPTGEIAEIIAEANKVETQRLAALVEANTSYTITGIATAGKQGTTFFVQNPSGEQYALKVLKNPPLESKYCAKEDLVSYIREASLTAQLDHPFIPKVTEVLRIGGSGERQEIAVVSRLIEGNSLKELIANRSFKTEEQVRSLLQDVGEILSYLHNQRVIKLIKR
jgi:serine/threonine protein kinase